MLKPGLMSVILFMAGTLALSCNSNASKVLSPQPPVSHEIWDGLLQKYVRPDGFVDYKGFVLDSAQLNSYLALLSSAHPQKSWPKAEQMAYWINAYNAFTVKLIVDHYPVESIKDIKRGIPFVNSVWDIKFIEIQGQTYDLNNIEHGILRKEFNDARIHAAINCASYSCPPLRNEAYWAGKLDSQLDDAMRHFVNDPLRNQVSADKAEISQIFSWFSGDFKRDAGSVRDYINRYAEEKLRPEGKISYLDYNWSLNDAR
ncbi:MAG: DUF547 domain-containing protein [Phaeodactylibacter sp.]|nr:DUF547 domain-containing protein [Phaeodactylibacter sp.]MCB9299908.1 DUF547 domain-containing protein [Lewinellaceae bacterium]